MTNRVPPEVIMRIMRTRTSCLRACYERVLASEPSLEGRVEIRFVVDLDGYVRKARVEHTTLKVLSVGACVAREVVGMQFPTPEGDAVTVLYPFTFHPR